MKGSYLIILSTIVSIQLGSAQTELKLINPSLGPGNKGGMQCNDLGKCLLNTGFPPFALSDNWGHSWELNQDLERMYQINGIVEFCWISNDVCFLFGSNGTLYKSLDGGYTLDSVYFFVTKPYEHPIIRFLNPDTGFLYQNNIDSIYITKDGGYTWNNLITVPEHQYGFNERFKILNDSILFYGFDSALFKSVDLGINWSLVCANAPDINFQIVDDTTFYGTAKLPIYNGGNGWPVAYAQMLYKSFNTGVSWNGDTLFELDANDRRIYSDITWTDKFNGYFYSYEGNDGGVIHRTKNGGKTWKLFSFENEPLAYNFHPNGIYFPTRDTGFVLYGAGVFYRTTNGGETWEESYDACTFENLKSVIKVGDRYLAIGANGTLVSLDYQGMKTIEVPTQKDLMDIEIFPTGELIMSTYFGDIFRSVNNGVTWTLVEELGFFVKDLFVDDSVALVCGNLGNDAKVFVSRNYGDTWNDISPGFNNPNQVYNLLRITRNAKGGYNAFGNYYYKDFPDDDHGFEISTFDEEEWNYNAIPEIGSVESEILHFPTNELIVFSVNGSWVSIDSGITWQQTDSQFSADMWKILETGELVAYKKNSPLGFYISTDMGNSWELLSTLKYQPSYFLLDFEINSSDTVMVGRDGLVLASFDASSCPHYSGESAIDSVWPFSVPSNIKIETRLQIYPNPSTGIFTVRLRQNFTSNNSSLAIFDINGKLVRQEKFNGLNQIDLNQERDGIYFIHVNIDYQVYTEKILLIHQ